MLRKPALCEQILSVGRKTRRPCPHAMKANVPLAQAWVSRTLGAESNVCEYNMGTRVILPFAEIFASSGQSK